MDESMSGFCVKASGGGGSRSSGAGNNNKCGRWNPTAEQVKVLTDLFRSGLRTPSTDQIQKISCQLSFYGKIESKNVFYWFQNHKARERQKRRRIVSVHHVQDRIREDKSSFGPPKQIQEQVTDAERVIETLQLFPLNSYEESEEKMRFMRNEYKAAGFGREMDYMQPLPLDLRLSFL